MLTIDTVKGAANRIIRRMVFSDLLPGNWTAVSWKFPVLANARREHLAMKRSKFSEGQIAYILRQAEECAAIGEVCRKAGISEATFYVWRKKYAGLMPSSWLICRWTKPCCRMC